MKGLMFSLFTKYYPGNHIKEYEIKWTCSTNGKKRNAVFGGEMIRKVVTW